MLKGILCCHSLPGLVDEELLDQVKELLVLSVHCQHIALQEEGGKQHMSTRHKVYMCGTGIQQL